jgi:hypothetical protein
VARWRLTIKPKARRLRSRSKSSAREPASSPYETGVERFARRHPRIALTVGELALTAGSLAALVGLVEHWSLPRSPGIALLTGAATAMISAASLVRLRRDGFAAPIPILVASWLPVVLAAVAALQPDSAGGWAAIAGYGFMAVYLAGCGVLLGLAPRITRHEDQLRRALFRERRRATLRALQRRPPRHPHVASKARGPRPSS